MLKLPDFSHFYCTKSIKRAYFTLKLIKFAKKSGNYLEGTQLITTFAAEKYNFFSTNDALTTVFNCKTGFNHQPTKKDHRNT